MYTNNPFQTWHQPADGPPAPRPSIAGALPFAFASTSSQPWAVQVSSSIASAPVPTVPFHFVLCPTLLDCAVTGPDGRVMYTVRTNTVNGADAPLERTVMARAKDGGRDSENAAVIEWYRRPVVETWFRGVAQRQRSAQFVALNSSRNARRMEFEGREYIWKPANDAICLFDPTSASTSLLARVTHETSVSDGKSSKRSVWIEISTYAIQAGLAEPCVLSTVLLLCDRNID